MVKILKSSEMVQSPMYDIPLERGTKMQENEPSYDFIAQTVQESRCILVHSPHLNVVQAKTQTQHAPAQVRIA